MYTQILGCVIMGYATGLKPAYFDNSDSRLYRVLYLSITSGLCGSITSFSSWMLQCNKNLFLQGDLSYGNYYGSFNAGRFMEFVTSLIAGVAIPIMALRFGKFLFELHDEKQKQNVDTYVPVAVSTVKDYEELEGETEEEDRMTQEKVDGSFCSDNRKEWLLFVLSVLVTLLIVVLPSYVYPTYSHLTYCALFGAIGAYLRLIVAPWNALNKNFPIGTFTVNIVGTLVLALATLLSRHVVGYYDTHAQAALYGVSNGFCGCLTTVSTFVNELNTLPSKTSYRYGIVTNVVAQIGIVIIFNLYAYSTVPLNAVSMPAVDLCYATSDLCNNFLTMSNCSQEFFTNIACTDMSNYDTFIGTCSCRNFHSNRHSKLLVDSQIKSNFSSSVVSVWPTCKHTISRPTEVIDVCLTFENLCDLYLNRISCPRDLRSSNGCSRRGILHGEFTCECGDNKVAGSQTLSVIATSLLNRRSDLTPYTGYVTNDGFNFSAAYELACNNIMVTTTINI